MNRSLLNHLLTSIFLIMIASSAKAQKLEVTDLSVEYLHNPIGLDASNPRFAWKIKSNARGTMQKSYELRVGLNSTKINKNLVWQSGTVKTDSSIQISYAGLPLKSKTCYYWQVRVKDNHGNISDWSEVNFWEMGLLQPADWTAKWISTTSTDTLPGPSPYFRKSFTFSKPVKSAKAYITAHGLYEASINGEKIGKDFFTPGWTSYHNRLLYQTYDVTKMLQNGRNTLGLVLGDGWYRGYLAYEGKRNLYGNLLSGLLQLEIEFTDGTRQVVQTDESWKYAHGPILSSDLYNGETYDARLEQKNWDKNSIDVQAWKPVSIVPFGTEKLEASISPLARKHEEFKPKQIIITPKGETVIDFGQNLVGWVKFNIKGIKGSTVKLEHGEVLDKQGNFYSANLRSAKQLVTYTLNGSTQAETYEPHFSYQGFRYVKLDNFPGKPNSTDFTAIAIYSDMPETGSFSTSNPLLNQLQHNIQWGQKGNFLDVPTDCPQRDERLGWTGDAQVFSRTAAFNMDVAGFFTKWMKDVQADQLPSGSVPFVVPNVLGPNAAGSTGWADAAVIIPWNMYMAYGDQHILSTQYQSMKAWVNYMDKQSINHLWSTGSHFGDWLFYRPDDDNDGNAAITDKYLIAQTFFAHSTQLLINTANVLGNTTDAEFYQKLLDKIKKSFLKEYLTPNGRLVSGSQTAYVLALEFDMLPEDLRPQAAARLAANIKNYGNHLTTGFLGTPYLCHVLSRFGYTDVAYTLLLQDTYPSWLYQVKMGATTMWERWDGQKPDGTFQTTNMNSFNHYAYGAIGDWMYRKVAGLNMDETVPGYKKISIAPSPGGNLNYAEAKLKSIYGDISVKWTLENKVFKLDAMVPVNTSATIILPGAVLDKVKESGLELKQIKEISNIMQTENNVKLVVGSGNYHFEYPQ
ncbi:MAG: family 78 glycoside hydrolase catalytic domain [Janthinobacterium lividum]